ncbi:MAG: ABC transporter permease [Candidatus Koribacter versatilis]|uniref:ABC transporter permease n=1 Tax=Candidatus Korobacter versatilis TaxID=658062 RepID=A0A932EPK9_9BACT|nr:ABC transporter permease [Candidatus Koribacter versatilis]
MMAYDMLELAGRNLKESKLRNMLTTAGIAVGVASLVALLSLGIGLQAWANRNLNRSGIFETVAVFSKRDFMSFDSDERRSEKTKSNENAQPLDAAARNEIAKLPNVVEVYPEMRFQTEVVFEGHSQFSTVAGLPLSARGSDAFDDAQGRFFSGPEADEVVLQEDFAKRISPNAPLLGKQVTLRYAERSATDAGTQEQGFTVLRREKTFTIVGIVKQEPYGGWRNFARGRLFIPVNVAEKMNVLQPSALRDAVSAGAKPTYISLLVRVGNPKDAQAVQEAIKKMGFTTWSALDASKGMRRFFLALDLFLIIFGSLGVAVASLGIINTLVMAILERRREIGIMKAIGASDADVKRLFFAEAAAMGLAGGAFGVALGWAIGRVINLGTNWWFARQDLPPENFWLVPWWLVAAAIVMAVIVSLVSGLYPAARAAKLDPVQALRYE